MTAKRTWATTRRVIAQLRRDPRSIALMIVVPIVLMALLKWVFDDQPQVFNEIGLPLLGIFPFITMFLITSVATLRERTSGTLERLLAMPLGKGDLIIGYQLAFGFFAFIQSLVAVAVAVGLLGLDVVGPLWAVVAVSVLVALLGTSMGLAVSAFARTEFQAVQFMPAVVFPQVLLCGLLAPRESMAPVLRFISDLLPLSYAVDAMTAISTQPDVSGVTWRNMAIVAGFAIAGLIVGATTLPRQSE